MRTGSLVCLSLLAVFGGLLAAPVPPGARKPVPNELPRDWNIEEIAKETPPYGGNGRVFVLAWNVKEDERPLRVETCLVLKELDEDSENGRWCLAHLYRHPRAKDAAWRLPPLWVSPPAPLGPKVPVAIDYAKRLKEKPTNKLVYDALKDVQWSFTLEKDWKLVSCAVCEKSWEAVIGEKPTQFFEQK